MEQKIKSDTEINIGKNIHDLRKAKVADSTYMG